MSQRHIIGRGFNAQKKINGIVKTATDDTPLRHNLTRSSAIAEEPRDASCQLKYCQLLRNSAETTFTTSPEPNISCS